TATVKSRLPLWHLASVLSSFHVIFLLYLLPSMFASFYILFLCAGRYSEESSSMESNAIMKLYKDVVEMSPDWEDGHFCLAHYYDLLLAQLESHDRKADVLAYIVRFFSNSLQHGNKYIYQSMPRMLSLWLDFGATVAEQQQKKQESQATQNNRSMLTSINK
ncbi:PREDICTED: serine/threonine-protein kinase atr-like, partial [Priapulus caudatus]|uniref:Serine/threonine-protein kinase atr-like n=1 Tax=Priapulus caudatus TaxID=37621 RepID=A0ABM1F7I0_PRICU